MLMYTIIMSQNKSESESDFGPGVGVGVQVFYGRSDRVWSPKFSNPGVGVGIPQKQGLCTSGHFVN